jgi:hypothetical protein
MQVAPDPAGPFKPDPATAAAFLAWWFERCTRGQIEIGSLSPGTRELRIFERFNLRDVEAAAAYAAERNAVAGANVYFRACTVSPAFSRTTDEAFLQAPGPWVDHDSPAAIAALSANSLPIKPTGWVITGRSPHMRAQTYWHTADVITDASLIREMNKRLCAAFAGDSAATNPSRLMRLPGSIAWPIKQGRETEMTAFQRPTDGRRTAIPVAALHASLPAIQAPAPPVEPSDGMRAPLPPGATGWAMQALRRECDAIRNAPDGGKHAALNKAAYSIGGLVPGGMLDGEEAYAALRAALESIRHRCDDFAHAEATLAGSFKDGMAARRAGPQAWTGIDFGSEEPAPEGAQAHEGAQEGAQPKPSPLWVDMDEWTPAAIPKRPWVVPGYFMRGAVSILSGQGAGGKSSLIVCWTVAGGTGQAVGDFKPTEPLIMVNYNVEDELDEQRRRYSAALTAANSDPAAIRNRVIRCGPHDVGTLFERDPSTGRVLPTLAMGALEKLITDSGADVLICDPLAELHNAEENDNTAMRAVVAAFRSMAKRLNIAVMVLHHDRKGNNTPGDMDRMRGASAVSGAVRVALTLSTMSQEEADKFGIAPEDRRRHFRVDGAKSNYAPAQDAEWWRLDGIEIANGETVAACRPWMPPSMFDGLSLADCVAVLDAMHAGTDAGHAWAAAKQAGQDWAGALLVQRGRTESQAQGVLRAWEAAKTIQVEMSEGPRRGHPRKAYTVNMEAVSEMRRDIRGANSQ